MSRITVVETVYHQTANGQVVQIPASRFGRNLRSDEQPFVRHTTADEGIKALNLGWLESCGMLILHNTDRPQDPSGRNNSDGRVLQVELVTPLLLLPGESLRFQPKAPDGVKVRCLQGVCPMSVYAFPE